MGFHSDTTSRTSTLLRAFAGRAARPKHRSRAVAARAARQVVESLEERRLLAIVNAGETAFFYNGTNSYKIQVTGNTGSFTFTAAIRPTTAGGGSGGGVSLGEVPMTVLTAGGGRRDYAGGYRTQAGTGAPLPNLDIYSILGVDTSATTSLSITQYTVNTTTPSFSNPFNGAAGSIDTNIVDPGQDAPQVISLANGGVFIGARQLDATMAANAVVLKLQYNGGIAHSSGVSLKTGNSYNPGIYISNATSAPASVGNLFIAGTITGKVNVTGSVNTFYAGNVITGDPRTRVSNDIGSDNFVIGGDLRNLIVAGGIGTLAGAPDAFRSNTQLTVGGHVQQIKAGGTAGFRGAVDVGGNTGKYTDGSDLVELESRGASSTGLAIGTAFDSFQLLNQSFVNNDTFATPQILGSFKSDATGKKDQVTVSGSINNFTNVNDSADYYGLSLIAGQSVVVQLQSISTVGTTAAAYVQVFDPDGRLIAQDRSNQSEAAFFNRPFTVKANQPGLYRLAVVPLNPTVFVGIDRTYSLSVNNVGSMGLGGLTSATTINLDNPTAGVRVRNGDLGSVYAQTNLYGADFVSSTSRDPTATDAIRADKANIRSVEGSTISLLVNGAYTGLPNIVAAGTIGLIRANTGYCYFNDDIDTTDGTPSSSITSGGDYQVVQAAADLSAYISTNGAIGVIRANSISSTISNFPGYFQANANGKGNDGIIGLIDCNQDYGRFSTGGAAIDPGIGGNVRYMNVGGTVYRDRNSGSGQVVFQEVQDQSITVRDDSGALITIVPITADNVTGIDTTNGSDGDDTTTGSDGNPIGSTPGNPIGSNPSQPNPIGGTDTIVGDDGDDTVVGGNGNNGDDDDDDDVPLSPGGREIGGTLTVGTFPTRRGGSVIFSVQSSTGVEIDSSGTGPNAAGDIGKILTGSGTQAILNTADSQLPVDANNDGIDDFDPSTPSLQNSLALGNGQPLEVVMRGIRTNVFQISGGTSATPTEANYSRITNSTDGEIVNLIAGDVGSISAQFIGVSRQIANTTTAGLSNIVDPSIPALATSYPFNQAKTAIRVNNLIDLDARCALGNIAASGVIQNVVANSDSVNVKGTQEGILGPVFATGSVRRVEIGEGLQTSGSGETATGGIFAGGAIGPVTNANGHGDLRGDIIAGEFLESVTLTGGGSIVDADILQAAGAIVNDTGDTTATQFQAGFETITFGTNGSQTSGVAGIGPITVAGTGGIINANVTGQNIALVTVASTGFGVLTSRFLAAGAGSLGGISAGGLGIRSTTYTGGGTIGDIIATGGGGLIDLDSFGTAVRQSEETSFDANTGIAPNAANDLLLFFQTSEDDSSIVGVTNSGIIADTTIAAARSAGRIQAFDFRALDPTTSTPGDESFSNSITVGDRIDSILAKRNINGLRVVTGSLGTIQTGGTMSNLNVQTTGTITSINARKNILGTTRFNVTGEGSVGSVGVNGNLNGTIFAAQGIGSLIVDGDLRSSRDQGGIYSLKDIQLIKVSGDVLDGSYVRSKKAIKSLTINGDFESGAIIRATKFSRTTIRGSSNGTLQLD